MFQDQLQEIQQKQYLGNAINERNDRIESPANTNQAELRIKSKEYLSKFSNQTNIVKSLSDHRDELDDLSVSPKSRESTCGSPQNALDLRPGMSNERDKAGNYDRAKVKRMHPESIQAKSSSPPTSPDSPLSKRLKV